MYNVYDRPNVAKAMYHAAIRAPVAVFPRRLHGKRARFGQRPVANGLKAMEELRDCVSAMAIDAEGKSIGKSKESLGKSRVGAI